VVARCINDAEPPHVIQNVEEEMARLAGLSRFDYERARKQAAKHLGVRAPILDKLVLAKRAELGLEQDDGKQGRAIALPEPEPWPEPVEGIALLDELAKTIGAYVVMPDSSKDAIALWTVHTYLVDQTFISPRLAIRSPTKQCGKTTLIDILAHLVLKPLRTDNVSPSAVFRVIAAHQPTILIDEADAFARDNDELRGILNSGHRRGGHVLRNVGDEHEPRAFATFAATTIATIGTLPGTLIDRSVIIDLKRRKADEKITPFRLDRTETLDALARQIARWAQDHADAVAALDPEMPEGIINRAADNWRPLVAIADVIGGEWQERVRKAILASDPETIEDASLIELLLGDIRDVFGTLGRDRISSAELIENLVKVPARPWAEFGKSGKPLTPNKLARLLKPLAIGPHVVRIGDQTPSGYERHQFEEAFERYLSGQGGFKPQHPNKADGMDTSDVFQTLTPEADVEVRKSQKRNNHGDCLGVEVRKGANGQKRPELPNSTIAETAEWYEQARYARRDEAHIDATMAQALRERLVNRLGVFPADLDAEVERVMACVFEPLKPNGSERAPRARAEPVRKPIRYPRPRSVGSCSPETPCAHCQKTGGVEKVVDDRHPGSPGRSLHVTDCAAAYFQKLEATKLNDDVPDDEPERAAPEC
jgi:putative DNA primase/helicase